MKRGVLVAVALFVLGCGAEPTPKIPAVADNPCHAAKQSAPPEVRVPPANVNAALEGLDITAIAVKGNVLVSAEKITSTSRLTVGTPYHAAAIAHAIVALYRTGEIDDVQVRATETDGGVGLELLVRERPFVSSIFAPGATPEETTTLATRLGLAEGRRLDIADLHLRMLEEGAPAVDFEIVPKRDNKVDVCLYRKTS